MSHSVREWEAYVTVDLCGDDTFARAIQASDGEPRIRVKRNPERRYSLRNHIDAIQWSEADPEDVIVSLDGDDWFATDDALRIIADAYDQFDCWITYGSWISNAVGGTEVCGMYPAYPEGTADFRHARWQATAVRTWKKWLWDRIRDSDLRDDAGEYFRIAEDRAIMLPLLEMCGTPRAKHIAAPLMIYNNLCNYPVNEQMAAEAARNLKILESRPPYARL